MNEVEVVIIILMFIQLMTGFVLLWLNERKTTEFARISNLAFIFLCLVGVVLSICATNCNPGILCLNLLESLFGLLCAISFLYYTTAHRIKILYSKKKWIRKAIRKVEYLKSYEHKNDTIVRDLEKILYLCESCKIPSYVVSTVFEINLPSYLKLVKEYKHFMKGKKNAKIATEQNTKIFGECTMAFLNLISNKLEEVEEMVKQGYFESEADFAFKSRIEEFNALLNLEKPYEEGRKITMTEREVTETEPKSKYSDQEKENFEDFEEDEEDDFKNYDEEEVAFWEAIETCK